MSERYEREKIFEYLHGRNWPAIIRLFRDDVLYQELQRDPIAHKLLSDHFVPELLRDVVASPASGAVPVLEQVLALHADANLVFSLEALQFRNVLRGLAIHHAGRGDIATAYAYARQLPDDEPCQAIIRQVEPAPPRREPPPPAVNPEPPKAAPEPPKTPPAERREPAREAPPPPRPEEAPPSPTPEAPAEILDAALPLFPSDEAYLFFSAVGQVYSRHLTLPRVALSAVIDFEVVRGALTREEQEYFFKALIDCVVFEEINYTPIQFLELDRREPGAGPLRRLAQMKEKIVRLAGHELLLIGGWQGAASRQEFTRLVREQS